MVQVVFSTFCMAGKQWLYVCILATSTQQRLFLLLSIVHIHEYCKSQLYDPAAACGARIYAYICMQGHIYGRTPDREQALRSFTDGKMKVSTFNGTDYPPLLSSIQQDFPNFTMNVPSTIQIDTTANGTSDKNFFAVGDPRFNMHLGHLYWATRALQLHNSLCDLVLDNETTYTDQHVCTVITIMPLMPVLRNACMHMQHFWEGSNPWAGTSGLYKTQGTQNASCMHPKCTPLHFLHCLPGRWSFGLSAVCQAHGELPVTLCVLAL